VDQDTPPGSATNQRRDEFLGKMYDRLWENINRHILVSWQSITTVFTATAALALVEKQILQIDVAASLVVIICGWAVAHLHDASEWFGRNLAMVANIERQFLAQSDAVIIHPYFAKHRSSRMLRHFRIQYMLVTGIAVLVIGYHFVLRVLPGLLSPSGPLQLERALPYVVLVIVAILVWNVKARTVKGYNDFVALAPGSDCSGAVLLVTQRAKESGVATPWP
jgi:hypothetical protein